MSISQKELNHAMVDKYAEDMKARLDELESEGREGWYDPTKCHINKLFETFNRAIDKTNENFLDIGIIAGMLLWRKQQDPEHFPSERREFYIHMKSGRKYELVSLTKIQVGDVWVPAVVYRDSTGVDFVRLQNDFERAFERATK